jgi:RHS repeat-associated protein
MSDGRWGRTSYAYDDVGQLTRASRDGFDETFAYDVAGSVVGASHDPSSAPWPLRPGNVLIRTGRYEYEHDECCRRTKKKLVGGTEFDVVEYQWDCRGRLREARLPDGSRVLFAYDAYGRRMRKEIIPPMPKITAKGELPKPGPSRVVEYLWDGARLLAEYDSVRGTRVFVADPATWFPLLQDENGNVYSYVTDHVGTPKEILDAKGAVVWSARHSAWGTVAEEQRPAGGSSVSTPFRLLGQYWDEETELGYTFFRYFDPDTVRWISPDPLGLPGGANLAAFNGTPNNHVDVMGLACMIIGNPSVDGYIKNAFLNPQQPGFYAVWVHGSDSSVAVNLDGNWGSQEVLTPQQLAGEIQGASNYNGSQPIALMSCNTGSTTGGVGAQVSGATGNTVWAPNQLAWSNEQGFVGVYAPYGAPTQGASVSQLAQSGQLDPNNPGTFNQFQGGQPVNFQPSPTPQPPP